MRQGSGVAGTWWFRALLRVRTKWLWHELRERSPRPGSRRRDERCSRSSSLSGEGLRKPDGQLHGVRARAIFNVRLQAWGLGCGELGCWVGMTTLSALWSDPLPETALSVLFTLCVGGGPSWAAVSLWWGSGRSCGCLRVARAAVVVDEDDFLPDRGFELGDRPAGVSLRVDGGRVGVAVVAEVGVGLAGWTTWPRRPGMSRTC